MKITKTWLKKQGACKEGYKWFASQYPAGTDHKDLYKALQAEHKDWGYWLLGHIGGTEFAIRCAMTVYTEPTWVQWAQDWLSGKDRTWAAAEAAAAAAWAAEAAAAARAAWAAAGAASAARAAWVAAGAAAAKPDIDLLAILDECECMKGGTRVNEDYIKGEKA